MWEKAVKTLRILCGVAIRQMPFQCGIWTILPQFLPSLLRFLSIFLRFCTHHRQSPLFSIPLYPISILSTPFNFLISILIIMFFHFCSHSLPIKTPMIFLGSLVFTYVEKTLSRSTLIQDFVSGNSHLWMPFEQSFYVRLSCDILHK